MKRKIIFGLIVLIISAIFGSALLSFQINKHNKNSFGEKVFEIKKGEGVKAIVNNLVVQGVLSRPFWFKAYVALSDKRAKFVDGKFNLRTDMSIKEIVNALLTQNSNKEIGLTFIEGWNVKEMDAYLAKEEMIQSNELNDYSEKFNATNYFFLIDKPSSASLEGYLFPDTYRVYRQTTIEDIVKKMLDNFDQKLMPELRQEIKKQKRTIFDVVTLASIVEKEMFGDKDRRIVAGIFLKRLKAGMPLQSDATINYVTKKGMARPSLDDLAVESLYNTYKYPGLPPGPIDNPGLEAIKAAIYPIETPYWYFLTTTDGQIIFSQTHDEHVKNKQQYLK